MPPTARCRCCISRHVQKSELLCLMPLTFPVQYCDLAQDAQLALTVWQIQLGKPVEPLGSATLRLFSKKGRLKSGRQELRLWRGREADVAWPSATPAKLPVAQRGELG